MEEQLKGRFVFFATDNVNKYSEAKMVLAQNKIAVGMLRVKSFEIQSENLAEIAKASVAEAFERYRLPLAVEDAGLFIEAMNGFPGPYAAYAYKTLGNKGLLKLMGGIDNRKASFKSVVAYYSSHLKSPACFEGIVPGEIVCEERRGRNKMSFGFDPIFRPDGSSKTFAQMSVDEKCEHSHRAAAFRKLAEWYK
jgi:XTP/dITP diphosphohydrolase